MILAICHILIISTPMKTDYQLVMSAKNLVMTYSMRRRRRA
jgi:hypothetical protein